MSERDMNQANGADAVFADPVAYLASFGIEATLVTEPVTAPALPAAA